MSAWQNCQNSTLGEIIIFPAPFRHKLCDGNDMSHSEGSLWYMVRNSFYIFCGISPCSVLCKTFSQDIAASWLYRFPDFSNNKTFMIKPYFNDQCLSVCDANIEFHRVSLSVTECHSVSRFFNILFLMVDCMYVSKTVTMTSCMIFLTANADRRPVSFTLAE